MIAPNCCRQTHAVAVTMHNPPKNGLKGKNNNPSPKNCQGFCDRVSQWEMDDGNMKLMQLEDKRDRANAIGLCWREVVPHFP